MIEDQTGIEPQDEAGFTVPLTRVVVIADAHLRTGGATRGLDNIIETIPAGEYPAFYQCAGEEVFESGHTNFWWVKIAAGPGGTEPWGWVSATLIKGGADNGPILDVPPHRTIFD